MDKLWPGWETVRLIGRGSFGAVYEIERKLFENSEPEKAAMKVISIPRDERDIEELYNDAYDEESITSTFRAHMESIMAEYTLMRKMNGCSNIVNCDDVMYVPHVNGVGWDILIKMELLTSLPKAVPLEVSDETVVQIAVDMCEALELCDKHDIIHRDIKPQNIFVSRNGDYKLGDFGIAKTVEQTMGGTEIGTYRYMAPEVYNHLPYGKTADIYSLGLVLYWLLNERRMPFLPLPPVPVKAGMDDESRKRRFSGETLPAPKNGSGELKRIVLKACAFDPKDRYQTALEMQEDLERLSGRSVPEPDPAPEVVKPEPEVTKPARKDIDPVMDVAPENSAEKADAESTSAGPVFSHEPELDLEKTDQSGFEKEPGHNTEPNKKTSNAKPMLTFSVVIALMALLVAVLVIVAVPQKKNGWVDDPAGGRYYYINGEKATGMIEIDNKYYYFDSSGMVRNGLKNADGKYYWFGNAGEMLTGWRYIEGSTYYFGDDGAMLTGWREIDGNTYYFGSNGIRREGWQIIEGKDFYFDSRGRYISDME